MYLVIPMKAIYKGGHCVSKDTREKRTEGTLEKRSFLDCIAR